MADIQPTATLRDHPNVFQLPGKKKEDKPDSPLDLEDEQDTVDPQDGVNAAYQGIQKALDTSRSRNLNEYLLDDPERPEIDQQKVEKNKKLAKRAAIVQLIDSLSGAGELVARGDEAIVAPARYDEMGLSALNNLANLEEQQHIDLRQYNRSKQYTDRLNQELKLNLANQQDRANLQTAQVGLEQAKFNLQQELSEEERERLENDKQAAQNLQIGMELASRGHIDQAREFLSDSGLGEEKRNNFLAAAQKDREKRLAEARRELEKENRQFAGVPEELRPLGITQKDLFLYDELKRVRGELDPDKHYQKQTLDSGEQVPDFTKPIPGSPAEELQDLRDDIGSNYYLINRYMGSQQDGPSREYLAQSEQMQQSPEIQQKQLQAQKTMQSTLMHGYVNAQNEEQRQQSKELWMKNNSEILRKMDVDEDEITSLNEEMFELMKNEMSGTRSTGNLARGREGSGAGDRPAQAGRRDASNSIDDVYNTYKNAGVQVKSRQTEKLRNIYGDQWKDVLSRVKMTYPQRNEDFLMYLMAESPELIQQDQGIKPSLQTAPALSTGITLAGFGKVSDMSNSEFRERFKEKYGDVQTFEELSEALNLSPEEARGLYQDMMIQMSRSDLSDSVINNIAGRLFGVDMKGDLYPVSIPGHFADRISSIGKDAGVVWDALQKSLEKRRKEYERRAVQSLIDSLPQQ